MRLTDETLREIVADVDEFFCKPDMVVSLARDLLACREMLRKVEWRGDDEHDCFDCVHGGHCPACGGAAPGHFAGVPSGHRQDCALAALLGGEEPR